MIDGNQVLRRILRECAKEYEDSAAACDLPSLAAFRMKRRARARMLYALAAKLPIVPLLTEEDMQ